MIEKKGLVHVKYDAQGDIVRIEDCLITQEQVLNSTLEIFDGKAKELERASIQAISETAQKPLTHDELGQALSKQGLKAESIEKALAVSSTFELIQKHEGGPIGRPLYFNPYIWGNKSETIAKSIANIDPKTKKEMQDILEMVHSQQGIPAETLASQGYQKTLTFLRKIGLIDVVTIHTAAGVQKEFVTTPEIAGAISIDDFHTDVFDDIKVCLDSFRYGQHYGKGASGKIRDIDRLLTVLLEVGQVGPCTAIGVDYILLEKAGIVELERATTRPGTQFYMKVLKKDIIKAVADIVKHRMVISSSYDSGEQLNLDFAASTAYTDPETNRLKTKKPSKETEEAFAELINKLRAK